MRGRNFLLTMLRLVQEREELQVVDDQIGAPTWSRLIADATAQILAQGKGNLVSHLGQVGGLYHLTASGETSWYGFAEAIAELNPNRAGQTCKALKPIPSSEYPTAARRPDYSVLGSYKASRAFALDLPDWRAQLKLALTSGE
jgi:dTDP-4-dehydrorhamnose reductase